MDDHLAGFASEIDSKYKCHPKELEREKRVKHKIEKRQRAFQK